MNSRSGDTNIFLKKKKFFSFKPSLLLATTTTTMVREIEFLNRVESIQDQVPTVQLQYYSFVFVFDFFEIEKEEKQNTKP